MQDKTMIKPGEPADSWIHIADDTFQTTFSVEGNHDYCLSFDAEIQGGDEETGERVALVLFAFYDSQSNRVASKNNFFNGAIGEFLYLVPDADARREMSFTVPQAVTTVKIGFGTTGKYPGSLKIKNGISLDRKIERPLQDNDEAGKVSLSDPRDRLSIPLNANPVWASFQASEHMDLAITVDIQRLRSAKDEKVAIVWFNAFDSSGNPLSVSSHISAGTFGFFRYLDAPAEGSLATASFRTPASTAYVRIGLSTWGSNEVSVARTLSVRELNEVGLETSAPLDQSPQPSPLNKLISSFGQDSYVPLARKPRWITIPVRAKSILRIGLGVDGERSSFGFKSGLYRVKFLDGNNQLVPADPKVKHSPSVDNYFYIDATEQTTYKYDLPVPAEARTVQLGFQVWTAEPMSLRVRNKIQVEHLSPAETATRNRATPSSASPKKPSAEKRPLKRAHELKVALICDEFTFNSFKYEFRPVVIEPGSWRETFEKEQPDLFFCESAWSGVDSEKRPWKGRVYSSVNFDKENRTELLQILEYCKENGVPTVFWNKEDPSHFDDRVHNFVDTASKFDYAFTTDADCVERYRSEHGFKHISALPFATQPRLFNPITSTARSSEVIFAGSWYANHKERSADMESILDSILDAGLNLQIYDRYYGTTDELHKFPERFVPYTRPAVSHSELANIYKATKFGLNINTVTDSTTMFARRVFELMSSNTLVISNPAEGLTKFFADNVLVVRDNSSVLNDLQDDEVERIRDENLHHVLSQHTYASRFKQILDEVGLDYQPEDNQLALVSIVSTEEEIRSLVARYRYFSDIASKLVLVIDDNVPDSQVRHFYSEFNRHGTVVVSRSLWRKQPISPSSVLGTSNFALVSSQDFPDKEVLRKASLHLSYIDGPVLYGASNKYEFVNRAVLTHFIAPSWYLGTALLNAGTEVSGSFYLV